MTRSSSSKTSEPLIDPFSDIEDTFLILKHKCESCSLSYSTSTELENHKITEHRRRTRGKRVNIPMIKKPEIFCNACDKSFISQHNLERHYNLKHSQSEQFVENCLEQINVVGKDESEVDQIMQCCNKTEQTQLLENKSVENYVELYDPEKHNFTDPDLEQNFEASLGSNVILEKHDEQPKEKLSRRKKDEISVKIYCDVCKKGYTRYYDMKKHRKQCHPNVPKQICSKVYKKVSTETELSSEEVCDGGILEINVQKYRRRFEKTCVIVCTICDKSYSSHGALQTHYKLKHSDVCIKEEPQVIVENVKMLNNNLNNSSEYQCKGCNKYFNGKWELDAHVNNELSARKHRRKRTEIDPEFFCDVCNKGFTRKFDMQKHRENQHADVPSTELSRPKGERRNSLNAVKVIGPNGYTYYRCDVCNKIFKNSTNMQRHKLIHTQNKKYSCHICNKKFYATNSLKRHVMDTHYGWKRFACMKCGKKFTSRLSHQEHMNLHDDIKPYCCDECGKAFRQRSSLYAHKLFHSNNFKFTCSICEKKFRRRSELKSHIRIHTGEKPYKCNQCDECFHFSLEARRHMKKVHKELESSSLTSSADSTNACEVDSKYASVSIGTNTDEVEEEIELQFGIYDDTRNIKEYFE